MDKTERLQLLKERGRLLEEKAALGTIPFTKGDIQDEISGMDTFREAQRDQASVKGINSDER